MRMLRSEEQIHIIDSKVTVEEIMKDIVSKNVIITYVVTL